jgi:hypothetical protein
MVETNPLKNRSVMHSEDNLDTCHNTVRRLVDGDNDDERKTMYHGAPTLLGPSLSPPSLFLSSTKIEVLREMTRRALKMGEQAKLGVVPRELCCDGL